jgi:hypothetical protein
MNPQNPLAYLWENLASLMGQPPDQPGLLDRITKKVGGGRGTLQRIQNGKKDLSELKPGDKIPSVELRSLMAIAEAFSVEVWEMLRPPRREASQAREFITSELVELSMSLSEDELAGLVKVVKLAVRENKRGTTEGPHDLARVNFVLERRPQDVQGAPTRKGVKSWMEIDPTRPGTPPPLNPEGFKRRSTDTKDRSQSEDEQ